MPGLCDESLGVHSFKHGSVRAHTRCQAPSPHALGCSPCGGAGCHQRPGRPVLSNPRGRKCFFPVVLAKGSVL